jgi:hypothetical protein
MVARADDAAIAEALATAAAELKKLMCPKGNI